MDIDGWIDQRLAALHGNRAIDPVMYAASWWGDDGRGWIASSAVVSLRTPRPLATFARHLVWLGIESALVNGPAKAAVRRPRPSAAPRAHTHRMRRPTNSSFPSGHAASAATMAALLSEEGLAPLWWCIALTVAASRVYLGVHHTSDVAAGLVAGAGIGLLARRVDLPGLPRTPRPA